MMKSLISACVFCVGSIVGICGSLQAGTVTFGSGTNSFQMEFVPIGDPGNAADTIGAPNPAGSVSYVYGMAKYEVSFDMITKYNANFGSDNSLYILTDNRSSSKPATSISWNEAARFVNWLNTSTGGYAAYRFDGIGPNANTSARNNELWDQSLHPLDYNPANPFRSKRARFVLPRYDEWYKAAYYDPSKTGGAGYWFYATGSQSAPQAVSSGTLANSAIFQQPFSQGPADVNQAGGLSPYGVMGLGGNVNEWEETTFDLTNSNSGSARAIRGGYWAGIDYWMTNQSRGGVDPFYGDEGMGFRVAMVTPSSGEVPEPSSIAIFGLGAMGLAYHARRKAKA